MTPEEERTLRQFAEKAGADTPMSGASVRALFEIVDDLREENLAARRMAYVPVHVLECWAVETIVSVRSRDRIAARQAQQLIALLQGDELGFQVAHRRLWEERDALAEPREKKRARLQRGENARALLRELKAPRTDA